MDDVPMLKFSSASDGIDDDENLLMDSKSLESLLKPTDEGVVTEFEEPVIPNLTEELSSLEAFYNDKINQLKNYSIRTSEDYWNGFSDHLTELVQRCDGQKLELLKILEDEKKLSNQLSSLRIETAQLRSKKSELNSKISSMESTIAEITKDLDQFNDLYDAHMSKKIENEELLKEIDKYFLVLGLSLELKENNHMVIKFSELDLKCPEKEYICHLDMGSSTECPLFKIIVCNPPISDINRLESLLNETKDLSGFVITLRRKFMDGIQNVKE